MTSPRHVGNSRPPILEYVFFAGWPRSPRGHRLDQFEETLFFIYLYSLHEGRSRKGKARSLSSRECVASIQRCRQAAFKAVRLSFGRRLQRGPGRQIVKLALVPRAPIGAFQEGRVVSPRERLFPVVRSLLNKTLEQQRAKTRCRTSTSGTHSNRHEQS